LEAYVIETIENLGTYAKGRYRTLEGNTTTFSLRTCPPSVEVNDEAAVPAEFKTLLLKVPAVAWEELLDALDVDQRAAIVCQVKTPEVALDKRSIKAAIDNGARVAGADLVIGRHSLRRS
jgi:Siphovirus Gp157